MKKTSYQRALDYLLHTPAAELVATFSRGVAEYYLWPRGGAVSVKDALALIERPDVVPGSRGLLDGCPQSWVVLRQGAL
jgi:hypothetical protein